MNNNEDAKSAERETELQEINGSMEELFAAALRGGFWFYLHYQSLWFAPHELREKREQGLYQFPADNWQLRDPEEKRMQLSAAVTNAQFNLKKFEERIDTHKRTVVAMIEYIDADGQWAVHHMSSETAGLAHVESCNEPRRLRVRENREGAEWQLRSENAATLTWNKLSMAEWYTPVMRLDEELCARLYARNQIERQIIKVEPWIRQYRLRFREGA